MISNVRKFVLIILAAIFAVGMVTSRNSPMGTRVAASDDDAAAIYKSKCAMCHKAKAEKFYDAALPDDEQVQAILNGKKAAKPPDMPAFGSKGITADQAKALMAYMKSIKEAPKQ
jgi:mono/diheme cytochrome c family protein